MKPINLIIGPSLNQEKKNQKEEADENVEYIHFLLKFVKDHHLINNLYFTVPESNTDEHEKFKINAIRKFS